MVLDLRSCSNGGVIDLTRYIRPGDRVLIGQATAEPRSLVEALIAQRHKLGGVQVFLGASFTGLLQPEHADVISMVGLGGVGQSAALAKAGVLEIMPIHLGQLPSLISSGELTIDVAMVQLSSPDERRNHSFGLMADYINEAVAAARVVLGEINSNVPFTLGDTSVPTDRLAATVHDDRSLIEVLSRPPSADDIAIAAYIAPLIPDGATLQMGIGGTPDAVAARLTGASDLGVHSGIMTDAVVRLHELGVLTNARKEVDRGVSVTGALFGTSGSLYAWANENPTLQMRSLAYTHDSRVLSSFDSFWALNSAIEVDLSGQINGEIAGGNHVGTIGGQGAFARAAIQSRHGRSIIALPSTAAGGTLSRIVPRIASGIVTTSRADADLVVTEYGIADLRSATISERARRLIAVAHPMHRESLAHAAGI